MTSDSQRLPARSRPPVGVLVLLKAPVPGRVKTRLARHIGDTDACAAYVSLVRHTLAAVSASRLPAELWIDGDLHHPLVQDWVDHYALASHRQRGRDLGERMHLAVVSGLRRYQGCLVVGSDCATLRAHDLMQAARGLRRTDAVIAPSWDGGYVLLGLNRPAPELFRHMPWSTRRVHALTRRRVRARGWCLRTLRHQHDVDRVIDLRRLAGGLR